MKKTGQYEVEETIEGVVVSTTMLDPLTIYELAPRVVQIVAPVFGLLSTMPSGAKDAVDMIARADLRHAPAILNGMMAVLSAKENHQLPQELFIRTEITSRGDDGKKIRHTLTTDADINDAFRGRPRLMYRALWFVIMANFADFFSGVDLNSLIKRSMPSTQLSNSDTDPKSTT